jgi:hypothetical protein
VPEYSRVSSGLIGGELMASAAAPTPSSAATKPSPVIRSIPRERLMRMTSCPSRSRNEAVRSGQPFRSAYIRTVMEVHDPRPASSRS